MSKQLSLFPEDNYVPFVSEVEQFNKLMNKPNNYEPTIPGTKDWHWEKISDMYIVYRTRDRKVMKSINYFRPDLEKFFTNEELTKFNK